MCDCCHELLDLMIRYDREVNEIVPADDDPDIRQPLSRSDVEVLYNFFHLWQQRRCNCIFRDSRNIERLNNLIRGLLFTSVSLLKHISKELLDEEKRIDSSRNGNNEEKQGNEQPDQPQEEKTNGQLTTSPQQNSETTTTNGKIRPSKKIQKKELDIEGSDEDDDEDEDIDDESDEDEDEEEDEVMNSSHGSEFPCDYKSWTQEEREKLLHLTAKVFFTHFPVYTFHKHSVHQNRLEDLSSKEAALLGSYCDLSDSEVPVLLFRNVTFFCHLDVLDFFIDIFARATPETLPLTLAHGMVLVIHHLKMCLNLTTLLPKLVSLRSGLIQYLCKVPDKDLRIPVSRGIFEFMWSTMKDPLETSRNTVVDKEGLALALKYFTSTTLTMRLTGIAQINNYITLIHDTSQSDSNLNSKQVEILQDELTKWILSNQLIEHIFGPNLHVEVIKQSHTVLSFVVSHITPEHVDAIWAAAQLKHCSKQVHDLLMQLVKNMRLPSVFHLYLLLTSLEPKDHNENTLHLTSCILKYIWSKSLDIQEFSIVGHGHVSGMAHSPSIGKGFVPPSLAQSLVKSPIQFTILPTPSNDGESTSASADGSDEDEDDDFDVELPTVAPAKGTERPALTQASPASCSDWSHSSVDEGETSTRFTPETEKKVVSAFIADLESTVREEGRKVCIQNVDSESGEDEELFSLTESPVKRKKGSSERKTHKTAKVDSGVIHDLISIPLNTDKNTEDEHSNSSQNSQTSQKRMSDFEGEDSEVEEMEESNGDVVITASPTTSISSLNVERGRRSSSPFKSRSSREVVVVTPTISSASPSKPHSSQHECDPILSQFSIDNVCKPGQTLLWDLLQDDKIHSLPDGLSMECEKILLTLICWINDRRLRMRFIEGCLANLEDNTTVAVSLRLLPKLLSSFQHFRGSVEDVHRVTLWADSERNMLKHFFTNLIRYCTSRGTITTTSTGSIHPLDSLPTSPPLSSHPSRLPSSSISPNSTVKLISRIQSHSEEIQIRLFFLSFVYSTNGSPESFKMIREHMDILWSCLAHDTACRDELFAWIFNQIRRPEQHSLSNDLYQYILVEKMPKIQAENFTMTALEILQCLCVIFLSTSHSNPSLTAEVIPTAIKLLWDIALTANNTDVSMAAVRHLNAYYIHAQPDKEGCLSKENEFIEGCMRYLKDSALHLPRDEERHSTIIQRALTLLKTHLEVFRMRFSFHLRKLQLDGDTSIVSHRNKVGDRIFSQTIRVVCQAAHVTDKTHIEMQSTDMLGELRAEITHWWEHIVKKYKTEDRPGLHELSEGPIRLLSQGQELFPDLDEKSLGDLQFKDLQLVYLSVGANKPPRRMRETVIEPASILPPPPKLRIPFIILLKKEYFEQLFDLTQQLGSMCGPSHIRAQVLSRRVWDIIQMTPTSPDLLTKLQGISSPQKQEEDVSLILGSLLNPRNPQKLVYCVQIVDWLRRTQTRKDSSFAQDFVDCGGLQHIFDIFVSGILQQTDTESHEWNEWKQDCLASLLQLIYKFGLHDTKEGGRSQSDMLHALGVPGGSGIFGRDVGESSKKKARRKGTSDKMLVHTFTPHLLSMLKDVDRVMNVLLTILNEASSRPTESSCYQTGFWGRAQVIHHTIVFITSWAFSDCSVGSILLKYPTFPSILKKLVLDDPDPAVRREACTGFYKMCLGSTLTGTKGTSFIPSLLNNLLSLIPVAQSMRTPCDGSEDGEGAWIQAKIVPFLADKEPYGPGCKDYFWLVSRLLDSLDPNDKDTLNFDRLCESVTEAVVSREILESRHVNNEDEGLKGLLGLMTVALKHDPPFKFSSEGRKFLVEVFNCLFSFPTQLERNLPKCKSTTTRATAFDLLVELVKESEENYLSLVDLLQKQHTSTAHPPYPWDFWPHDDTRSECGYVGLINLGATCYMASCLQHLFMIPEARKTILSTKITPGMKHESILYELQRMFAFLQESERKSYNPRNFCKVYTMDHELLNTGEQKDMTEFFTDLISKFEEMTDDLKQMVKRLFGGTLSNNVVSLDCPHISRTTEEFYTLRCKVADMRNIFDSLDDLTVKDTLEGDNMYTCSQCGKKVRAEKRACIKKLPHILCFNTMRYTFNMITMTKEKVNTHFSFPLVLDMSPYLEENLIPPGESSPDSKDQESHEYELIGVTVHTGTAEGGHYYSFIREREACKDRDKWYMFNDAEVRYFDPSQLGAECFGGEMTSKTYDSVTEKFMDFSFEKTNSAYMLFYERIERRLSEQQKTKEELPIPSMSTTNDPFPDLPSHLSAWIWEDNTQFLRDQTIFEHHYFEFMYQICSNTQSMNSSDSSSDIALLTTKLTATFLLETLVHSKEKPTLPTWVELLTKQFNASPQAGEWFLDYMAEDSHWSVHILLKSPNQMVRQLFQRVVIHVIGQLRITHKDKYLQPLPEVKKDAPVAGTEIDILKHVGQYSCITRFIKKLLTLIKSNQLVKPHPKYLTEYFTLLLEFAKLGEEECRFLLIIEAISHVVQFYLNHCKGTDFTDVVSDDEDEEDDDLSAPYRGHGPHIGLEDKVFKPASMEKMVAFVAYLVEKSRNASDNQLHLGANDKDLVFNSKGFPFIHRQIRDSINLKQTLHLIISYSRYNESGAAMIVNMTLQSISRQPESSNPFFRMLSLLTEQHQQEMPGLPNFSQIIYRHFWEIAEHAPQPSLEFLQVQVIRNRVAHAMVLNSLENWVEFFLIAHANNRVRIAAAMLLVSLVPNNSFRQSYNKSPRVVFAVHHRDQPDLSPEALGIVQRIFSVLLTLLKPAKEHADTSTFGVSKLVSYFNVMSYCLVSKNEKQMLVPYFNDLWNIFQPKLSEPPVPINNNKQALLHFWFQACLDCPENVRCIVNNPNVVKNIAFNYILADHDDQDVIMFNRLMLPSYYGLLRLCCQQSRPFTRMLASHQNIQWAFKNITPYTVQYPAASTELFKLMKLFVQKHPDSTENDLREIRHFKQSTLHVYIGQIDPRSNWASLTTALNILVEDLEDKIFVIANNGISCLFHSFNTLFVMFHEATACHVTNEIVDILKLVGDLLEATHETDAPEVKEWMSKWKDHQDAVKKLVHLLNTYTPASVRVSCLSVLEHLIQAYPKECIPLLVQCLGLGHLTFQDQHVNFTVGPYFPRRGQRVLQTKSSLRPAKAVFQMAFHPSILEIQFGVDADYDKAVVDFFSPYYAFVVNICRTAVKYSLVNQELAGLCAMVALESLPMSLPIFVSYWKDLLDSEEREGKEQEKEFLNLLCKCNNFGEYVMSVVSRQRGLLLNDDIFDFMKGMIPRVKSMPPLPNVSTISTALIADTIRQDPTIHGIKDFHVLLSTLRCLFLTLSYESSIVSTEFRELMKGLKKQITNLLESCNRSSPSPVASPMKKQKTSDSDDENMITDDKSQQDTCHTPAEEEERAKPCSPSPLPPSPMPSTSASLPPPPPPPTSSFNSAEASVYQRIQTIISAIIDLLGDLI